MAEQNEEEWRAEKVTEDIFQSKEENVDDEKDVTEVDHSGDVVPEEEGHVEEPKLPHILPEEQTEQNAQPEEAEQEEEDDLMEGGDEEDEDRRGRLEDGELRNNDATDRRRLWEEIMALFALLHALLAFQPSSFLCDTSVGGSPEEDDEDNNDDKN